jgi:hypothetical protein
MAATSDRPTTPAKHLAELMKELAREEAKRERENFKQIRTARLHRKPSDRSGATRLSSGNVREE